nr:hypothetical protein L203_06327 [Cryptococcus depauperatus CBS 7841]
MGECYSISSNTATTIRANPLPLASLTMLHGTATDTRCNTPKSQYLSHTSCLLLAHSSTSTSNFELEARQQCPHLVLALRPSGHHRKTLGRVTEDALPYD